MLRNEPVFSGNKKITKEQKQELVQLRASQHPRQSAQKSTPDPPFIPQLQFESSLHNFDKIDVKMMRIGANSLPCKIRASQIAEVHADVQLTLENLA